MITAKAFTIANQYVRDNNEAAGEDDQLPVADFDVWAMAQIAIEDGITLDAVMLAPVSVYSDRIDGIVTELEWEKFGAYTTEDAEDGVIVNGRLMREPTGRDAMVLRGSRDLGMLAVVARCAGITTKEAEKMPVEEYFPLHIYVGKALGVYHETF